MASGKIENQNAMNDANRLVHGSVIAFTPTKGTPYSNYDGCFYYKIGTRVTVHIGIQGLTANSNNQIFTMPSGYRPAGVICMAGTGGQSYTAHAHATVSTTGTVVVASADAYANITLEYDAFS